jgi:hypothetical protein
MEPLLLDGDVWLVGNRNSTGYLHDGQVTTIPDLPRPTGAWFLRDGTIQLSSSYGTFFGVGSGMQYRWTKLTLEN